MPRRGRLWWAAAAVALVMTACSGPGADDGEGEAGETSGVEATTTVPVATTAPVTTAAGTTVPATTAADTTVPATTAAPAELTDDQIRQEVIKGYELYLSGVAACGADPENCNPDDYAVPGSVAADSLRSFALSLFDQGLRGAANPGVDRFVVERLEPDRDGSTVEAWTCTVDGAIVSDLSGAVVNDAVGSVRTQWTFVPFGGGWRVNSGAVLEDRDGDRCPAF